MDGCHVCVWLLSTPLGSVEGKPSSPSSVPWYDCQLEILWKCTCEITQRTNRLTAVGSFFSLWTWVNRPLGISVVPAVAFFDTKIDYEDGPQTTKLSKVWCFRWSCFSVQSRISVKVIKRVWKSHFLLNDRKKYHGTRKKIPCYYKGSTLLQQYTQNFDGFNIADVDIIISWYWHYSSMFLFDPTWLQLHPNSWQKTKKSTFPLVRPWRTSGAGLFAQGEGLGAGLSAKIDPTIPRFRPLDF